MSTSAITNDPWAQYAVKPQASGGDPWAQYAQKAARPDFAENPPPAAGPHVHMEPSILGSAESMGPEAVQAGREAASRSFRGIHGPTVFDKTGMPEYQKPTHEEDASNGALVGSALTVPFTGGEPLLTRIGLMGAGAGLGSSGIQLAEQHEIDPNETAGDITSYGVAPELAGAAVGGLTRNGPQIGRAALAGAKAGVEHLPFVGAPLRYGLRAASREFSAVPVERAITRGMVPEYAGELGEGESQALMRSTPRTIQIAKPDLDVGKPSGRLVLSPEEAQAEIQQMRLAKRMASQRGMQYAAGQRPVNPGIQ